MTASASFRGLFPLAAAIVAAVGLYAYAFSSETPVGALEGVVVAADTGAPLARIPVQLRAGRPVAGREVFRTTTDDRGRFRFAALPVGAYEAVTVAKAYRNVPVKLTVREGETGDLALRLVPGDPFLELHIHRRATYPGGEPRVAVHGFRQGDRLLLQLYAVDPVLLMQDRGMYLRSLLQPVARGRPRRVASAPALEGMRLLREWRHPIRRRDAEGIFYEYVSPGTLRSGVYVIRAQGEMSESLGWLMVTDLALVTKTAQGEVLAYTTHLRTGEPVPGVEARFYSGRRPLGRLRTDAQGLARLRLPPESRDTEVSVVARRGESVAFMHLWPGFVEPARFRVFTGTDRPVYRPGHTVRFKGVARRLEGSGYALPEPQPVEVAVIDPLGTVVGRVSLRTNDLGAFAGEFQLSPEAATGLYTLEARIGGERHEDRFAVAAYRKPEWQVEVLPERDRAVRGDSVAVTVRATYYYGAPVASGRLRYTIYRTELWPWMEGESEAERAGEFEAFDEFEPFEAPEAGEVVESGERVLDAEGVARLQLDTSRGERPSGGAGDLYTIEAEVVDLSDRAVTGRARVQVLAGEILLRLRPDRFVAAPGQPVRLRVEAADLQQRPAAGVPLQVEARFEEWEGNRRIERPLLRSTLRTDAAGAAEVVVVPDREGLLILRAEARDRRGNWVEGTADLWVTSESGGDLPARYPALSVLPDRRRYRPGDTARILLNTDRPGGAALVAIEADRLLDVRLVPLRRRSTLVRFPLRAGYEPNVWVTAALVRDRELLTSEAGIALSAEAHRLRVTIASDRAVYRPGETATYRIRTTDSAGRPAPAELSFAVIDESVYGIRPEPRRGLWEAFYPRRQNLVSTEWSFPQIYLGDADKDSGRVAARRNFPDTAFWEPFLKTDARGEATVRVRLPDTLTSWRATAVAHTARTEIGKGTHTLRVTKELILRLQTPRLLTEGDRLTLSAVVRNETTQPLTARVSLRPEGLRLESPAERELPLPPGASGRVEWEATAEQAGAARLVAAAQAGPFADAVEASVPIRPFARESVRYRAGLLAGGRAEESFVVDPAATEVEAELRFAPSLAGALFGSLEYLLEFPYGCTEQTMSGFLPALALEQALRAAAPTGGSLHVFSPGFRARLSETIRDRLLRLYRFQHPDGGWGWWEYDETDPWMTAWVLFGLGVARESGVEVDSRVVQQALAAARELAREPRLEADHGMFLAWVLARSGEASGARELLRRIEARRARLSHRGRGYRILALAQTGETAAARAEMEALWRAAEEEEGMPWWTEERAAPTEATAVALLAALRTSPEDPRLPGVVRWLLLRRNGTRWVSTRDTAFALLALAEYLRQTGELAPDYRFRVRLNGRAVLDGSIGPGDALAPERVVRLPAAWLEPENRLELEREGVGRLHYTLTVRQRLRASAFAPESAIPGGFLQREYFRLERRRDAAGRLLMLPAARPTTRLPLGETLLVRLTLRTPRPLRTVMLEEPLPAGGEVQDRGEVSPEEWGSFAAHTEVRDDRIAFFFDMLPPGRHVVEYFLRMEATGAVRVPPAVASDMYLPAQRLSTADARLEVVR